jgi:chromosome transmission fidelity protein 18
VFINVLNVSYIDPTMEKCYAAHEWLSEADLYRNGLESYIPPAAGAVHLLCRVEQRPDLTFTTRTMSDAHYSQESNQALLHRFAEGLSPNALITRGNGSTGLALEIVPYTLWILSAGDGSGALDRPVTSCELLSKGEMESFQKHVDTLKALGLSYRVSAEEKSSRHHSVPCLQLEPPIDRVAKYEGLILSRERSRREVSPSVSDLQCICSRRKALPIKQTPRGLAFDRSRSSWLNASYMRVCVTRVPRRAQSRTIQITRTQRRH